MVGLIAVGIPDAPDWMFECEARHFTGKRRLGLGAAADSRGNLVNSIAKGVERDQRPRSRRCGVVGPSAHAMVPYSVFLEIRGCCPHNCHMVVIPAIWKRFGRGFDSRHLHLRAS